MIGAAAALVLAGVAAGALGTAGAITSLVSYPALLAQPLLASRRRAPPSGVAAGRSPLALVPVGLLSVYGGYFGAGSGVMLLAMALVLLDDRLPQANALKNMLVGGAALASAAVFVVAGPVVWSAVAPLGLGLLIGSTIGPVLARRLPAHVVRVVAAAAGVVLAGQLWLHPSR